MLSIYLIYAEHIQVLQGVSALELKGEAFNEIPSFYYNGAIFYHTRAVSPSLSSDQNIVYPPESTCQFPIVVSEPQMLTVNLDIRPRNELPSLTTK